MKSCMNEEENIAKKDLELDLSARSGLLKSQKIQDYEALMSSSERQSQGPHKKQPKSNKNKRSNFSEFNKLI